MIVIMDSGYFDMPRIFNIPDSSSRDYLQRMEGLDVSIETSENLRVTNVEQHPKGF
jgi:hypothetical protein